MELHIPREIESLMELIYKENYEIYLVGGCVRDAVLGIEPNDYDLATNAPIEELLNLLSKTYKVFQVGKAFGTLIVKLESSTVELSLLRKRTDAGISMDGDILSDLMCRDFTINSMAYSHSGELVDPFGAREDIQNNILKSVEPSAVLCEDPLRAIRAVRFHVKYNLRIDEALTQAIRSISRETVPISPERLREEFFKILLLDKPSMAIREMISLGLFSWYPFENWMDRMKDYDQQNPYHDKTLLEHTLVVLDQTPPIIEVRLAALFHDVGKPDVQTFEGDQIAHYYQHESVSAEHARMALKGLNSSNQLIEDVTRLIAGHMFSPTDIGTKGIKRLIRKVGGFDQMNRLLDLMEADIKGTAYPERASCMNQLKALVQDLKDNEAVFRRKDLNITGRDLIQLGICEGRFIGQWLDVILELVIDEELENERECLMAYVKRESNI